MPKTSDPDGTRADMQITDAQRKAHPLAHLFASVERSVNEIHATDISAHDVRMQARDRGRGQAQVWSNLGNKRRGAR